MDRYLIPFFFNNIKPSVYYTNKNQINQINLVFSSKKKIPVNSSNVFLPVDITCIDLLTPLTSLVVRPTTNSSLIINELGCNDKMFNYNSGLNWPLRELIELFGVKGVNLQDNRNLLLDYSSNLNPLVKNFPCEGLEEIYFNFFDQKVKKFKTFFIEL